MQALKQKLLVGALTLSAAGLMATRGFEGDVRRVYLDPVGIPTVCAGHTATVTRADVGRTFSEAACLKLLRSDTREAESAVRRLVKVPITQGQYDVLVDFVFNKGSSAFATSTLLHKINGGQCVAAGQEFERWVYAKDRRTGRMVKLPGLIKRAAWHKGQWLLGC